MAIVGRFGKDQGGSGGSSVNEVRPAICTVDDEVGNLVCVTDSNMNREVVETSDPKVFDKLPVVGVIISKSTDELCDVQWAGETPAVFSGLDIGSVYFLGLHGKIVKTPPAPTSGENIFVQSVGIAISETQLYMKPSLLITKRVG